MFAPAPLLLASLHWVKKKGRRLAPDPSLPFFFLKEGAGGGLLTALHLPDHPFRRRRGEGLLPLLHRRLSPPLPPCPHWQPGGLEAWRLGGLEARRPGGLEAWRPGGSEAQRLRGLDCPLVFDFLIILGSRREEIRKKGCSLSPLSGEKRGGRAHFYPIRRRIG